MEETRPDDHTVVAPLEAKGDYPEVPGYEILGLLGQGGMGVVYQARQLKANRLVALKMLRADELATAHDRLRFQIETEAVARLHHPNIVQLHEVGEVRGQPYFSLELCEVSTLGDHWKKQRPTPLEAAAVIETLARAMHYAHLRGVVHRDLKPGNVLLQAELSPGRQDTKRDSEMTRGGHGDLASALAPVRLGAGSALVPKISDFGLAKRIDAETTGLSQSGAIMGTASYMAPEQAAGKVHDTGPAADVYALGALLYEGLTGRPPFEGATHVVLLSVLTEEPVPPARLMPRVPRDLETICLKCLSKEPARRYASAEKLADDLSHFRAGEPIQARPAGRLERTLKWARRRPALAALVGVTVLALVALAGLSTAALKMAQAARQEADKAKKARAFLVSIFELSDANGQRGTMTARQILDDAEKRIPHEFADQPELRAGLLSDIDGVYAKMTVGAPLAMILDVRGSVQLSSTRHPGQRAARHVLLFAGDRLRLADDAQVRVLILSDWHKEWLQPGQEATVQRKGCEPAAAIRAREADILLPFVRLSKGTFYMGWDGQKRGVSTEIKQDFDLAVHHVTQGQWEKLMGENPSFFSRFGGGRTEVKHLSDEELKLFPVESVSWHDTQQFLAKLNDRERGRGFVYRLPTEAEWEYACREGATSEAECSYHFYLQQPSNDLSSKDANFNGTDPYGKAPQGKYLGRTTRVGAYPPNRLGLCDMHGNVWQWCADVFSARTSDRIHRGGSFGYPGSYCRAAARHQNAPTLRTYSIGFRLARVAQR